MRLVLKFLVKNQVHSLSDEKCDATIKSSCLVKTGYCCYSGYAQKLNDIKAQVVKQKIHRF